MTVTQHKRTELCRVSVNIFLRFTLCLVLIDRLIKPVYMYTYDNYDLFVDWWAAQTWQYPQYVCLMTRPTCVRWLTAVRLRLLSESKSSDDATYTCTVIDSCTSETVVRVKVMCTVIDSCTSETVVRVKVIWGQQLNVLTYLQRCHFRSNSADRMTEIQNTEHSASFQGGGRNN